MVTLAQIGQCLRLGGGRLTDSTVEVDEPAAERLEAKEQSRFALGLAALDGTGKRRLNGPAAELVGESQLDTVFGMGVAGASEMERPAEREGGMDGTASKVAAASWMLSNLI